MLNMKFGAKNKYINNVNVYISYHMLDEMVFTFNSFLKLIEYICINKTSEIPI